MLSAGAVMRMFNKDTSGQPTVQLLDIKQIMVGNAVRYYRLNISDGQHYMQAMLATQLNDLVTNGQVAPQNDRPAAPRARDNSTPILPATALPWTPAASAPCREAASCVGPPLKA